MTEIPEHLLKRSQERHAAMGGGGAGDAGGGDSGGGDATPASAPSTDVAPATAAAPAAAAPATEIEPAAAPVPPYVEAALKRKRVPLWALPVLAFLPVWAIIYAATLEPPSAGESDPLAFGASVYASNCATCHGATGGGGVGPALAGGDVLDTFASPEDQIEWVELGSQGFQDEGRSTYGDNATPIGGGMPGWAETLSHEEIAAVVYYERSGLSGEEPNELLINAEGLLLVRGEDGGFAPVVLSGEGGGGH